MKNVLTIDLEDWFCANNLSGIIKYEQWSTCELRIVDNTHRLLNLLELKNVKATFFVLGWIAERVPDLIKEIENLGHEIASHGYSHISLHNMNRTDFERDIKKALLVKREIVTKDIIGYRSPSFSVTDDTIWALKILKENGFLYDSSVFPFRFHPDYGMRGAPLNIYRDSRGINEVPMSCIQILKFRVPFGGGAYFRFYPLFLSKMLMKLCNNQRRPFVFYLHPWEIDVSQPKVPLPYFKSLRHYCNIKNTLAKFSDILDCFSFTTIKNLLNKMQLN